MYRTTVTNVPLSTEGYFFSPHPFGNSDRIDALPLAIMLGTNSDNEAEVILVAARPDRETDRYQLAIAGKLEIIDHSGAAVALETLRSIPVGELNEDKLREQGWSVQSRPYFVWQLQDQPVSETRSATIYSSVHHQLKTLSGLM